MTPCYNESNKYKEILDMTATEFGQKIAGLRNEKKMTQTELAEVLGVSTQAVSKWETGVSHK